jgi:adenylate cyclase
MAQEIERKFIVFNNSYKHFIQSKQYILQGYLSSVPERTVRIRISGEAGFITIKGIGDKTGLSRFEWEHPITLRDAQALLKICEPGIIEKFRYKVIEGTHAFIIDEFLDDNEGLVIAELELKDENESFERPSWLGEEVTGDTKYYNSMLRIRPYSTW